MVSKKKKKVKKKKKEIELGFIFGVNIVTVFRILDQYRAKFLQEERPFALYRCSYYVRLCECHRGEISLRGERGKEEKWFGNLQTK